MQEDCYLSVPRSPYMGHTLKIDGSELYNRMLTVT